MPDAAVQNLLHFVSALLAESTVSNAQDFIENQDFRINEAGDREGKPALHAARELFEIIILKLLELRERDDFIILFIEELLGVAEHCAGCSPGRSCPRQNRLRVPAMLRSYRAFGLCRRSESECR